MNALDVVGLGYPGWDYLGIVPGPTVFADPVTLARLGAKASHLGLPGDGESGRWPVFWQCREVCGIIAASLDSSASW